MYPQKTYTLTDIVNKAVNWFNNLTPNQLVLLTVFGALVLSEYAPRNNSYYYFSRPKPLPRKDFSESTKKFTRIKQGNVCNRCKKSTDIWDYHHMDGNRSNNRQSNCEGLCPYCHAKITRNRK